MAASLGAVALLVGVLWSAFPRTSLARDVAAHMAHEPAAWSTTSPVLQARVAAALERQDVTLRPGVIDVQSTDTRVSGRLGEWITLGGVSEQTSSSGSDVLRRHTTQGREDMSLRLKVEALD